MDKKLNRCGACKNFERYTSEYDVRNRGGHAGTCKSNKFVEIELDMISMESPADILRYWDYEGYSAGFDVGDQFGCIHWCKAE